MLRLLVRQLGHVLCYLRRYRRLWRNTRVADQLLLIVRRLAALSAVLLIARAGSALALEARATRYDDIPPSTRTISVRPVPAMGKHQGADATLGSLVVARDGTLFVLKSATLLVAYDPTNDSEALVPLEVPEEFQGQPISFVSIDSEGSAHVCHRLHGSPSSTVVSYDSKGRFLRKAPFPLAPFLPSVAVGVSGEYYISSLSPLGSSQGVDRALAPIAPVLIIDKKGEVKGSLGEWDDVKGNAAEVAIRNLRIVHSNVEGDVILFRKDKYEFEVYGRNGRHLRKISVDARDRRKPHLYDDGKTPAVDALDPEKEPGPEVESKRSHRAGDEPPPRSAAPSSSARHASQRMTVDIPNVIRGVAVADGRVYVLRNPFAHGGKSPMPAIDVFDFFGRWEEQLVIDSRQRFDNLAVARDGTLYLISGQSDTYLWAGDLYGQPIPTGPNGSSAPPKTPSQGDSERR